MSNKIKTKILLVKPILTEEELEKREGNFFPESHYTNIIRTNTDAYYIDEKTNKKTLIFKFRKSVIPTDICVKAYNALEGHAKQKNHNRGAAAGKINKKSLKNLPNHVGKITKTDKYRVFYKTKSGKVSRDNIGNIANSNIAGYYDRPDRNNYNTKTKSQSKSQSKSLSVPMCRTTQFTKQEVEKWNDTIPLIKETDKLFKSLVPDRHKIQLKRAKLTPNFQIDNTAYSTITVNYNWRTASHRDSGDLDEGFGNLCVLEKAKSGHPECNGFTGGYLGFPRFGVCVDVRQGDFLAMDVHQYHSNTDIKGDGRLSVVCYLRKKMINCIKH